MNCRSERLGYGQGWHTPGMTIELQFLGAATTVTGSQFLLTAGQSQILIDCGMFQGSPNESIRNRIPLAFDPGKLDAILLTHAHLDHCGLIPHVVKEGCLGELDRSRQRGLFRAILGERLVRVASLPAGEATLAAAIELAEAGATL